MNHRLFRRAVSLIELLVVFAILGLVVSLILPAVQDVRRASYRVACQNQVKQIALGLHAYHDIQGHLPGPITVFGNPDLYTGSPGSGQDVCWPARLLPLIEQEPLWNITLLAMRQNGNPLDDPPHVGLSTPLKLYSCPSDWRTLNRTTTSTGRAAAVISYFGVAGGGDGVFLYRPPTRHYDPRGMFVEKEGVSFSQVTDGLSNTLLLGERPPDPMLESGWWYTANDQTVLPDQPVLGVTAIAPAAANCNPNGSDENLFYGEFFNVFVYGPGRADNRCDAFHYWSLHTGGANWAMADGSVRFLPYSAQPVIKALSTRAGGEVVIVPD
jgi:prepilin-type processing-associated H-X9-DG protein